MNAFPELPHISSPAIDASKAFPANDIQLDVSPEATFTEFMSLLEWLPEDREMTFFDQYFPSITDPGAYVSIRRHGDRFSYFIGNHGWSRDWSSQSRELLAHWMLMNLLPRHPLSQALTRIGLRFRMPHDIT